MDQQQQQYYPRDDEVAPPPRLRRLHRPHRARPPAPRGRFAAAWGYGPHRGGGGGDDADGDTTWMCFCIGFAVLVLFLLLLTVVPFSTTGRGSWWWWGRYTSCLCCPVASDGTVTEQFKETMCKSLPDCTAFADLVERVELLEAAADNSTK